MIRTRGSRIRVTGWLFPEGAPVFSYAGFTWNVPLPQTPSVPYPCSLHPVLQLAIAWPGKPPRKNAAASRPAPWGEFLSGWHLSQDALCKALEGQTALAPWIWRGVS